MFSKNFNGAAHEYEEQQDLIQTMLEQTGLTAQQSREMYRHGREAIRIYLDAGTFAFSEWLREVCNLKE
jgi:hypothetical protein